MRSAPALRAGSRGGRAAAGPRASRGLNGRSDARYRACSARPIPAGATPAAALLEIAQPPDPHPASFRLAQRDCEALLLELSMLDFHGCIRGRFANDPREGCW